MICQEVMGIAERRLALECGHAFHESCLKTYAECKRIPWSQACPYRCNREVFARVQIDMEEEANAALAEQPADGGAELDPQTRVLVEAAQRGVALLE